jgi:hypothetical protein
MDDKNAVSIFTTESAAAQIPTDDYSFPVNPEDAWKPNHRVPPKDSKAFVTLAARRQPISDCALAANAVPFLFLRASIYDAHNLNMAHEFMSRRQNQAVSDYPAGKDQLVCLSRANNAGVSHRGLKDGGTNGW